MYMESWDYFALFNMFTENSVNELRMRYLRKRIKVQKLPLMEGGLFFSNNFYLIKTYTLSWALKYRSYANVIASEVIDKRYCEKQMSEFSSYY